MGRCMQEMDLAERKRDWICKSCQNLNYSFRAYCNRCKQDRMEVGMTIPAEHEKLTEDQQAFVKRSLQQVKEQNSALPLKDSPSFYPAQDLSPVQ